MLASGNKIAIVKNGMVTITDKDSQVSATYPLEDFNKLYNACLDDLGGDYFLQALLESSYRLDYWIDQVAMNGGEDDKWLPALRLIYAHRFNQAPVVEEKKVETIQEPKLSPEEEEKRKQLAFFKSSSHDANSQWYRKTS